jgi:hypothetical protein
MSANQIKSYTTKDDWGRIHRFTSLACLLTKYRYSKAAFFLLAAMRGKRKLFSKGPAREVSIFADVVTILGEDAVLVGAELTVGYSYEECPIDQVSKKTKLCDVFSHLIALERTETRRVLYALAYTLAYEKVKYEWVQRAKEQLVILLDDIRRKRSCLSFEAKSRLRLLTWLVENPKVAESHLIDDCAVFLISFPKFVGHNLPHPREKIEGFIRDLEVANDAVNNDGPHRKTLQALGEVCKQLSIGADGRAILVV